MKTISALAPLLIALSFVSCTDQGPLPPLVPEIPGRPIVILDPFTPHEFPRDSAFIETTWVSRDNIHIIVHFQSGAAAHDFSLLSPYGFHETYPLGCPLVLSHDAYGDRGFMPVRVALTFSLLPLKRVYERMYTYPVDSSETIRLRVSEPMEDLQRGWNVEYHFTR